MAKEVVIYDPDHPNANVHGMVSIDGSTTCSARNPEINCTGCCPGLHIKPGDFPAHLYPEFHARGKQPDEDCPERISKLGCKFRLNKKPGRPIVCWDYHCSGERRKILNRKNPFHKRVSAAQRLFMESAESHSKGEIDLKTHMGNLKRIPTP